MPADDYLEKARMSQDENERKEYYLKVCGIIRDEPVRPVLHRQENHGCGQGPKGSQSRPVDALLSTTTLVRLRS